MKLETLMWLLPVVFMFHDFEEIIMMKPWFAKNSRDLQQRFPLMASRLLPHFESLSTSSFALAVAEEFLLLSVITFLAVEHELYALWTGFLLAFFFHLIVHLIQFALYRKYVPVIMTSLLSIPYCIFALYFLNSHNVLDWSDVIRWAIIAAVVTVSNMVFVHWLAARFEKWLNVSFVGR